MFVCSIKNIIDIRQSEYPESHPQAHPAAVSSSLASVRNTWATPTAVSSHPPVQCPFGSVLAHYKCLPINTRDL